MNNRSMLIAAGIGGLVMLALTKIPLINCLNCILCVSYWGGGILAVWVYRQTEKVQPGLTIGQGALVGLLAGVGAAVLAMLVDAIFSGAGTLASLDMIKNVPGLSTGASDILRQATAYGGSLILKLLCNLILYPLFGAIGGAIGAGMIWPK
jgi:hypothetical protein